MKLVVVDYGAGNLWSIGSALAKCGATFTISSSAKEIASADRVILPGVGAFKRGMEELSKHSLVEPIIAYAKTGRPLMGICLGMQMMLEVGEEFGTHTGLGLIPGKVTKIPEQTTNQERLKVPFIAWGELCPPEGNQDFGKHGLLANIAPRSHVYFVHSYSAHLTQASANLGAYTPYGEQKITAVIQRENVVGAQFHPEKSGAIGLKILDNFLKL